MHSKPAAAPRAIGCRQSAYLLAGGMIAAAIFEVLPAVWDVTQYFQYLAPQPNGFISRWALLLLLIGFVQLAYAVYVFQLPDWTTVWVATIFLLAVAGLYAMTLGLVVIASPSSWLLGPGGLQISDRQAGGQAALWCLSMIGISTALAYFAGRLVLYWHRTETIIRRAGL